MIVYYAGVNMKSLLSPLWDNGARNILISYAEFRTGFGRFYEQLKEYEFNILLDSGAYSAFTQGYEIPVEEYAAFLHEWKDCLVGYFNLDVIGDFDRTWDNQDYLEAAGLNPIPVVHYPVATEVLRIVSRQYDFIGLGGLVPVSTPEADSWLNQVFYKNDGSRRFPGIRFHGLGMTKTRLLNKYPIYSVDSTTWLNGKRFGKMLVGNGNQIAVDDSDHALASNIQWFLKLQTKTDGNNALSMRLF